MRGIKVKGIRQDMLIGGIAISDNKYARLPNGQIIASKGRRMYQKAKEMVKKGV